MPPPLRGVQEKEDVLTTLDHFAKALDMVNDSLANPPPAKEDDMPPEGQNLKPTLEWLRAQLAVMDGCCLDDPEDVKRVADHLFGNWVMVERSVLWELAAALGEVCAEEKEWVSVRSLGLARRALARYRVYNAEGS